MTPALHPPPGPPRWRQRCRRRWRRRRRLAAAAAAVGLRGRRRSKVRGWRRGRQRGGKLQAARAAAAADLRCEVVDGAGVREVGGAAVRQVGVVPRPGLDPGLRNCAMQSPAGAALQALLAALHVQTATSCQATVRRPHLPNWSSYGIYEDACRPRRRAGGGKAHPGALPCRGVLV